MPKDQPENVAPPVITESGNVDWRNDVPEHLEQDPPAPFVENDETQGDDESHDDGDPAANPAPAEDDSEVATCGGEGQ